GLRFVKGMGVAARGLAQVSMNLTDFEQTPIATVFEFVKREAARYGVMPVSSEIVGLVPKKALEDAAGWFLQIDKFDDSLVLENRLAAVMEGRATVGGLRAGIEPFIEQLAAPTPAPGGGSASAASAAMAAGLAQMVASLSRGKKNYAQYENQLSDAIARLDQLREEFKTAIDADAEAYKGVLAAYKYEKTSPDGGHLVSTALQNATSVPLRVAEQAREVRELAESLRPITNPSMASDLTVAVALADAAITGALANVEINLKELKNEDFVADVRKRAEAVKG
ncbi:MAG: cyclodeaminase/cyclohydrolase family protein, partial [Terriglobales bacterium]